MSRLMAGPSELVPPGLMEIGLDCLVDQASLQTRVDRKYVLSQAEASRVLTAACCDGAAPEAHRPHVLTIGGAQDFRYESVYFDTADLLSYRMAAHARRRRFKVRTRHYVDTDAAYLEVKTRGARDTTVKDRMEYNTDELEVLTADGLRYAGDTVASARLEFDADTEWRPVLRTQYRRATLFHPASGSRTTVDTALRWESDDGAELSGPGMVIIETKSGSRASEMDRALWSHGHRPARISKFGTGMAALRPDLPSNRWARMLRHQFSDLTIVHQS